MSEIVVPRAVDRSKYKGRMMFVDSKGNICVADRPSKLSEEEKAKRQEARDQGRKERQVEGKALRDAVSKARKEAKSHPSVENAKALEEAMHDYAEFKALK